jgi:hypothetical protein
MTRDADQIAQSLPQAGSARAPRSRQRLDRGKD